MTKTSTKPARPEAPPAPGLPAGTVVGVLAGLAAALIAAGDAGLLHHALKHALTWVTMLAAVVACWPERHTLRGAAWILIAVLAAAVMTASSLAPVNVMAVAILLAGLAWGRAGSDRRALAIASQAVAVLGLYRIAVTSIPALWMTMDAAASWLGAAGGAIAGQPLSVGGTFAGLDVLVLMAAFYGLWLAATPAPRRRRALWAAGAIVAGHTVYLVLLAHAPSLLAAIPVPPPEPAKTILMPSDIPPWSFWSALATLIPWNLVAVAGLLQLIVAGAMLRWAEPPESGYTRRHIFSGLAGLAATTLLLGAAVVLPVATGLYSQPPASLAGKKFVVNEKGFLNWLRPQHGEYGRLMIGMYGLLPDLVESYGGKIVRTTEFSDEDLKDADGVIIIFPNQPWKKGQLERIWKFVAEGHSLLVMGEHTIREAVPDLDNTVGPDLPAGYTVISTNWVDGQQSPQTHDAVGWDKFVVLSPEWEVLAHSLGDTEEEAIRNVHLRQGSRFNDLLFPTRMRVNFDCAEWAIGGWLDSYQPLAHPVTAWSRPDRNDFGVVIGASVRARAPARPIIVGQWGYEDHGDRGSPQRAMIGNNRYDAGERLGDVVLAAEEPLGQGKVIVFGDTSSLINGINIGSYGFTGGLLSYLGGRSVAPSAVWQLLGLLAALVAGVLVLVRPPLWLLGGTALVAAIALGACASATHAANTLAPDGNRKTPNNLAYIDMSHLEAFSQEALRDDGLMGLEMTLMRNGYLTLTMSDFNAKALQKAAVFVSVAPAREFTAAEREAVRRFVERGGLFICMAGWDERLGSKSLLAQFGLRVGDPSDPDRLPSPFGHFKAPFIKVADELHYVRFHAAWPVVADLIDRPGDRLPATCTSIANGPGEVPVIVMRPWGEGKVVLIGDTCFAMNKNLEHMDGSPFEGMRENADFWRWLISFTTGRQEWLPPSNSPPPVQAPGTAGGSTAPSATATAQAPAAPTSTGGQAASGTPVSAPAPASAAPTGTSGPATTPTAESEAAP